MPTLSLFGKTFPLGWVGGGWRKKAENKARLSQPELAVGRALQKCLAGLGGGGGPHHFHYL